MMIITDHNPTTMSSVPSPEKKKKQKNNQKRKVVGKEVRFSDEIDQVDCEDPQYSIDFSIWYNFKEHQACRKRDSRIVQLALELKTAAAGGGDDEQEKELEEKLGGETTRGLERGLEVDNSIQAGKRRKRSWETVQKIQSKTKKEGKGKAAHELFLAYAYAAVSAPAAREAERIAQLDAAYVQENVVDSSTCSTSSTTPTKACVNRTKRRRSRVLKFLKSRLSKALFQRQ